MTSPPTLRQSWNRKCKGIPYQVTNVKNDGQCRSQCANEQDCLAYTFNRNGRVDNCSLYNQDCSPYEARGFNSGTKECSSGLILSESAPYTCVTPEYNCKCIFYSRPEYQGDHLLTKYVPSATRCQTKENALNYEYRSVNWKCHNTT